ncbi:hypothetical protein FXV91_14645 [Methanosarcina sp. DH2]|uniref:hypothetical protein n=1 Tax=Methanosarcina sp. DH2 TaxID=2605639 RepID=UPI001E45EB01|nr:hypothetical protein [Methanosarcina sp. DH2]MCC4771355.1 hypothetical protein [Methanosarcina sp. DH2]
MTIKRKLEIGMLFAAILVLNMGTAMAVGHTYGEATTISVPEGTLWIYGSYVKSSSVPDWFKFTAYTGENVYIDLEKQFIDGANGDMRLYKTSSSYTARVSSSYSDHWGDVYTDPLPRIKIDGGNSLYKFLAGRNPQLD